MLSYDVTAKNFSPTPALEKYIQQKVTATEKYVPRILRESAHLQINMHQAGPEGNRRCTCEIGLKIPSFSVHAKETTQHMYAAVDVAIAHIRQQLAEYKAQQQPAKLRHRLGRHRPVDSDADISS